MLFLIYSKSADAIASVFAAIINCMYLIKLAIMGSDARFEAISWIEFAKLINRSPESESCSLSHISVCFDAKPRFIRRSCMLLRYSSSNRVCVVSMTIFNSVILL
ncbi:hypothetical protein [Ranid herpesvirus 3]|uniref:Uncharacterized protein n=1 Tax=Ranid herpesvirus 3 TaxID=1987509 RepID=A0A1X9T5I0_9VIRU|nr:hypothetical protein [Ranid herpesvirus 3]ARR28905.1 hypothetical protein [Ranid herpesvirus 3]